MNFWWYLVVDFPKRQLLVWTFIAVPFSFFWLLRAAKNQTYWKLNNTNHNKIYSSVNIWPHIVAWAFPWGSWFKQTQSILPVPSGYRIFDLLFFFKQNCKIYSSTYSKLTPPLPVVLGIHWIYTTGGSFHTCFSCQLVYSSSELKA